MLWRSNYTSDSGKTFYYVSLYAGSDWLPEIYQALATKGKGFCDLPASINPRYALITTEDGNTAKIEYPFAPGTAEWFLFWQQIESNPLIITSKGIGETVKRGTQ
jgi:hypothetical protein